MEVELRVFSAISFFLPLLIVIMLYSFSQGRINTKNRFLILLFSFLALHQFFVVLQINSIINFSQQAIPAVFCLLIYFPSFWFYLRDIQGKRTRMWQHYASAVILYFLGISNVYFQWINFPYFLTSVYLGSLLLYLILSFSELRFNDTTIDEKSRSWVRYVAYAYFLISAIYLVEGIFIFRGSVLWFEGYGIWASRYYFVIQIVVGVSIILKMIREPELFATKQHENRGKKNIIITEGELSLIEGKVLKERQYLTGNFSRSSLAMETGIPVNRISEIINRHYHTSFSEWINNLRIEESKRLLQKPDMRIQEVFYQIGFNSKSAFNKAFKTRTGYTPTVYRRKFLQELQIESD